MGSRRRVIVGQGRLCACLGGFLGVFLSIIIRITVLLLAYVGFREVDLDRLDSEHFLIILFNAKDNCYFYYYVLEN